MEARPEKSKEVEKPKAWWKEPRILTLFICGILILLTFLLEHILGLTHGKAAFLYGAATIIGGYYPAKIGLAALKTLTPNIRTLMVAGSEQGKGKRDTSQ